MSVLHPTKTFKALMPRFATRFSCTGADCEDSCCSDWHISIDKPTFNEYRRARKTRSGISLMSHVRRQRSNASDDNYAKVLLDPETRRCPLVSDGLCSVQRDFGADFLCDTCFTFPRATRSVETHVEHTLTLSCVEAARLAILDADALDIVQEDLTTRVSTVALYHHRGPMSADLIFDVRVICSQLLRTLEFELWQRLAALGIFCRDVQAALDSGEAGNVRKTVDAFVTLVECGRLLDQLPTVAPDYTAQATAFVINFLNRTRRRIGSPSDEIRGMVATNLGIDVEKASVIVDELAAHYRQGLTRLPGVLGQVAPKLLENYLLNELFREMFPFGRKSVYQHYLSLISTFGVLRLMLAALCNTTDGSTPEAKYLVRAVVLFCRLLQHDPNFRTQAEAVQQIYQWDQLANVYRFLRD